VLPAPEPIRVNLQPEQLPPNDVEMSLVDHLEELRQRVFRSLIAIVMGALACLLAVKPLVRLLEEPAGSIRFLQLAPGEFLFVSFKVAGYAGLTLAIPYVLYQGLAFVLPGLTRNERRLIAPAVAGSAVLFFAGLAFSWWALIPAALGFLVSYGADVVEPIWSIERYPRFCASADALHWIGISVARFAVVARVVWAGPLEADALGLALGRVARRASRSRVDPIHRSDHDVAARRCDFRSVFRWCGSCCGR
jgi:Tat protein translocase TatC